MAFFARRGGSVPASMTSMQQQKPKTAPPFVKKFWVNFLRTRVDNMKRGPDILDSLHDDLWDDEVAHKTAANSIIMLNYSADTSLNKCQFS
jgi:hypothetical protein